MFLLSACLLLGCVVLPSHCYQLKKILCQGSSCYYLYESSNHYVPWKQSYEACRNKGQEMLRIDSNQTQTLLERLFQNLPWKSSRQVWLGGRRSNDNTWRFMNGTVFDKKIVMEETSQTEQYCLYVRLCKGSNPEYHADNCNKKTSASQLLCQYDPSETGRCRSSNVPYGNKCYMKTQYNGREPNKIDWYNGQTYCSQSDIQGDIAYSYLDDDTLINNIIDLVHPGANCAQIWLGVRRRIWFWKTDSKSDEAIKAISYYNWEDGTEVDYSDSNCVYVNVDKRCKWIAASCTNQLLKYFTCMKGKASKSTTAATTSAITTSTGYGSTNRRTTTTTTISITSRSTATGINNTAGTLNCASYTKKLASDRLLLIIVSVILSVIVIGQTIYCIWFRLRKVTTQTQQPDIEVTEDITRQQTDNRQEPEYEITRDQNREVDTSVSPEYLELITDNNQYEKPTVYINMVDRRNEYESLNG